MKHVLLYEPTADFRSKVPAQIEAHRALWKQFQEAGQLLMIGPFMDASGGAMGIFTTKESAEAFANADPFVANGVVARWYIREWNEALVK